ncbi:hypothetical protein ABW20_dc0104351 [Dactylellina cionopaga]|nr:hypothetical protein ABW20_dc0104351 [Dactylellina cionopaga]
MATCDLPAWGYGLRYRYGIFKQQIVDGNQIELPDYWLDFNPWEFPRPDVTVDVQFYGRVRTYGKEGLRKWQDGEIVQAVAHDVPIPGYDTATTNNLRLWSSQAPNGEFDFQKFDAGDYESAVADRQTAETISAVLYPNDDQDRGRELRLKQQYLWCAASLSDITRRFQKAERPWRDFPDFVAIQLNGTHPALAIAELQRILVDLEELRWDEAWEIVTRTFNYTSHTILPEIREKWPVPLIKKLLPRHLQIIQDINLYFLKSVEKKYPNDVDLLRRVSIIEETNPKTVRMLHLAIVGTHRVNGVSELHSELLRTTVFKDFVQLDSTKFMNVTNGITPRRWLHQANPKLSQLIASKLGSYAFLKDLYLLRDLRKYIDDREFKSEWASVKADNKARLAHYIKNTTGISVDPSALFDIQVKLIHEQKRQQLNILGIIHRYLKIKAMAPEERSRVVPRVSIFGGKAAPGYWMAKKLIHFINKVGAVINKDPDVGDLLKVIFLEDYNVSKAEIICPASDISQHISTAGTEASGTSNMKFVLNGGLIVATVDGSNIEIAEEIGEENIFFFGHLVPSVESLRQARVNKPNEVDQNRNLTAVFDAIRGGIFGNPEPFTAIISSIVDQGDYYIVSDDFESYIKVHDIVDEAYRDYDKWLEKCILGVAGMGKFSADRAVLQYAEEIWNIEPMGTPRSFRERLESENEKNKKK